MAVVVADSEAVVAVLPRAVVGVSAAVVVVALASLVVAVLVAVPVAVAAGRVLGLRRRLLWSPTDTRACLCLAARMRLW